MIARFPQNRTIMKKIYTIIAAIAAIANMFNANAQKFDPDGFTPEGIEQMEETQEAEKGSLSRSIRVQRSNGAIVYLLIDGLKAGIGGGYAYSSVAASPFISAHVQYDSFGVGKRVINREADGQPQEHPVFLLTGELEVAFSRGRYSAGAASAGQSFLCYETTGMLKVTVFQDDPMLSRHRIDLIGGIGYTYAKDDHDEDFGVWQKVGTEDLFDLSDHVIHKGSGLMEKVGVSYSTRPFDVKAGQKKVRALQASRLEFRVLATHKPYVEWRSTSAKWGGEVGIILHFGGKVI